MNQHAKIVFVTAQTLSKLWEARNVGSNSFEQNGYVEPYLCE